jgi:aspartate carbamoyltransferase catalytic subunit
MTSSLQKKDLLGLKDISTQEMDTIFNTAESMKEVFERPIRKVPALVGKNVATLFYEPSTRTRTSFDMAAKMLSAGTTNIAASSSSIVKGETLIDTARNIEVMGVDAIVVRHSMAGAPHLIAKNVKASVINAGDGFDEHPTQGLLDIFTMRERKGPLRGKKVTIIGDIAHSRVARSNIWGLTKLGARVTVCGPPTLMPVGIEDMGVKVTHKLAEAIGDADFLNVLRIQLERQQKGLFPSIEEYVKLYGITSDRLKKAKKDVTILHPGPINRGIELSSDVADGPFNVILDQVTNGVAVRMAVLFLLLGGSEEKS